MTSVIPPWKQALIEKKRKKEQEEKAKTQVQNDTSAYSSLPEWKKNLLAKKKGVQSQGADTSSGLDKSNSTVSGYDRLEQKRSSFTASSTEREHESNGPPKVIIIPKEKSQNSNQGGVKQHSFVASSLPQPEQQKKNKQLEEKLSNNSQENFSYRGNDPESDETDSKVLYEHIKTPSELRKLFGVVSRDHVSTASSSVESNKIQNQQTQSKDVSTKPHRSSSTRDYQQSQKFTFSTHPQNSSREPSKEKEVVIVNLENELSKSQTPAKNEEAKENDIIVLSKKNNGNEINTHSEDDNRSKGLNDEEIPAEVHVDAIRTKFGPSGNFRLHKSSSSDNLLKSNNQQMSPRHKDKPPLNKRWSADVGGMLSPTKSLSGDEEYSDSGHNINMKRARSISMGDVRVDHHFQDMEPVVDLRHRPSISSGIERRLQVLLHSLSVSDRNDDDDDDDDDNENKNICFDQDFKDHFTDDFKSVSRGKLRDDDDDDDVPKIRKAAWFNPEDEVKETSALYSHKNNNFNEKPLPIVNSAVKSSISSSESHNKQANKPRRKHLDSGRNVVVIDKYEREQDYNGEEYLNNQEPCDSVKPGVVNGNISHEPAYDTSEKDEKPAKVSVYKLSSLFGPSIPKAGKKDKPKSDDLVNKTPQEQTKKEKKSNKEKIFPWLRKQKKSEPVKEEPSSTFSGASGLRPVQQEVIEQKITGNMTLVINKGPGSYDPSSKQKQTFYNTQSNMKPRVADISSTANNSKSLTGQNSQVNVSSSGIKNIIGNKTPPAPHKSDDMMVTVIDVPDMDNTNDIEVSAIDLPDEPSPTPVSVIDIPESPKHDVKVSVIDVPDDDIDSDDSDSSGSGMSGSYDINTISEGTEEDEEEDIDNVPVSYVGDSTYMKVPQVIFESKVADTKSCLSSPLRSRKRKAKVVFHPKNLEEVHDYPSEECMQYHYDQYLKECGGKSIGQYVPSSLHGIDETLRVRQAEKKDMENNALIANKPKEFKSSKQTKNNDKKDVPSVTYSDQGEGFTSSSGSGALLF